MKIDIRQFAGPQASSDKYDVLTALSLIAFERGGGLQVSVLRLIAIITARYNWRMDELCVCQRDMARMWGVTERTAKREVRAWIEARLMIRTRVGVRGRAGAYRLDMIEIREQALPLWARVGPDYVERMAPSLPVASTKTTLPEEDTAKLAGEANARGDWRAASRRMKLADPAGHAAWIAPLQTGLPTPGELTLTAPTRFAAHYIRTHLMRALSEAVEAEIGAGTRISIVAREAV